MASYSNYFDYFDECCHNKRKEVVGSATNWSNIKFDYKDLPDYEVAFDVNDRVASDEEEEAKEEVTKPSFEAESGKNLLSDLETNHSTVSGIPTQKRKKKPTKKNAFFMFMKERRPQVEAKGLKLVNGWEQLSRLVSEEWQAMSPEAKEVYKERAKKFNERQSLQKKYSERQPTRQVQVPRKPEMGQDLEELAERVASIGRDARAHHDRGGVTRQGQEGASRREREEQQNKVDGKEEEKEEEEDEEKKKEEEDEEEEEEDEDLLNFTGKFSGIKNPYQGVAPSVYRE